MDQKNQLAFRIATFFGAGLAPKAPGTVGSLAALPLVVATNHLPLYGAVLVWLGILGLGIWASAQVFQHSGVRDDSRIVIDEVLGMGVTLIGVEPKQWILFGVGFALFRLFDIWKPPPICYLDQFSKLSTSPWKVGWGVMADDLAAGLLAAVILRAIAPGIVP